MRFCGACFAVAGASGYHCMLPQFRSGGCLQLSRGVGVLHKLCNFQRAPQQLRFHSVNREKSVTRAGEPLSSSTRRASCGELQKYMHAELLQHALRHDASFSKRARRNSVALRDPDHMQRCGFQFLLAGAHCAPGSATHCSSSRKTPPSQQTAPNSTTMDVYLTAAFGANSTPVDRSVSLGG